jgi:hypothetical protein
MPRTTESPAQPRPRLPAVLCALVLGVCGTARAQDGVLRVRESALNRFAAAVQPLATSRSFSFTAWVPNPLLFPPVIPIPFNCVATASVTGLTFRISPASTTVTGSVTGAVCGVNYSSPLTTTVAVSLAPSGRAISIVPAPMSVQPTVKVLGFVNVRAPFAVSVSSPLAVSIPLGAVPFDIDTPGGPTRLVLDSRNLRIVRQNGFFEIDGDADFR